MHHCCFNYLTLNVQVVSLNVVVVECFDVSLNVVVWDVASFLSLKEKEIVRALPTFCSTFGDRKV